MKHSDRVDPRPSGPEEPLNSEVERIAEWHRGYLSRRVCPSLAAIAVLVLIAVYHAKVVVPSRHERILRESGARPNSREGWEDDLELSDEVTVVRRGFGRSLQQARKQARGRRVRGEEPERLHAGDGEMVHYDPRTGRAEVVAYPNRTAHGRDLQYTQDCDGFTSYHTIAQLDHSTNVEHVRHYSYPQCEYFVTSTTGVNVEYQTNGPKYTPSNGWPSKHLVTIYCCPDEIWVSTLVKGSGPVSGGVVAHDSSGYRSIVALSQGAPVDMQEISGYNAVIRRMNARNSGERFTLVTGPGSTPPPSEKTACELAEEGVEYGSNSVMEMNQICSMDDNCFTRRRLQISTTPAGFAAVCLLSMAYETMLNFAAETLDSEVCYPAGQVSSTVFTVASTWKDIKSFGLAGGTFPLDLAVSFGCSMLADGLFSLFSEEHGGSSRFLKLDDY